MARWLLFFACALTLLTIIVPWDKLKTRGINTTEVIRELGGVGIALLLVAAASLLAGD
jgi:L-asparagine transporter-like permease